METNNKKGYIIFDLLFSMVNTLLLIILIYVAYKISNHNIKSLLYISIVPITSSLLRGAFSLLIVYVYSKLSSVVSNNELGSVYPAIFKRQSILLNFL